MIIGNLHSRINSLKRARPQDTVVFSILILWTHWTTVFLNILSLSHLKLSLRYVGSAGFEKHQFPNVSMTSLNPRFARVNNNITAFPSVDLNSYRKVR